MVSIEEVDEKDELEVVNVVYVRRKSDKAVIVEASSTQDAPSISETGFSTLEECADTYSKLARPIIEASKSANRQALEGIMSRSSKKK